MERNRFKQTTPLSERLKVFAEELRAQASKANPGPEKEGLMKRLQSAETASEWIDATETASG
jgi:hypothetical protein